MESHKALKIFRNIFPNIKFSVKSVISDEIKTIFEENSEGISYPNLNVLENLNYLLAYLESELRYAKKKLSNIRRLYKNGEASIYEVQDHEFNVFEIEEEIEDIKLKLKSS
jgi:hypothetical protein